eukprot:scaffold13351_cov194-Alexandrium_tamarense.AAC.12
MGGGRLRWGVLRGWVFERWKFGWGMRRDNEGGDDGIVEHKGISFIDESNRYVNDAYQMEKYPLLSTQHKIGGMPYFVQVLLHHEETIS